MKKLSSIDIIARQMYGKKKIDINNAQHPIRQKAIAIMEFIAEYLGKPKLFDCKNGDTKWYDVEDKITEIINEK